MTVLTDIIDWGRGHGGERSSDGTAIREGGGMESWNRRRALKVAMAGAGAAVCRGITLAQGLPTALLRSKKEALVIGNAGYRHAPLRNPVNDARGIAGELKKAGFGVTVALDVSQADMRAAIRAYVESLAKSRAVGLFYFAGHGTQLLHGDDLGTR